MTIDERGEITVHLPRAPGSRVRVLILDTADPAGVHRVSDTDGASFVERVLADPAEDVWNDL